MPDLVPTKLPTMRSNGADFYQMATDALAEAVAIDDADGRLVWAKHAASIMTAELERHERYLRSALEHGPIGMAVVGADGRFIEVNPAFCRLGGWDHDALIGCSVVDITHRDDVAADRAMLRQMLERDLESFQLEKRYLAPDGTSIPVRVVVALVRSPDGGHNFITQCVDISAQRRVEAAQLEALRKERQLVAELREVERLRADFIATASHELRTPVISLLGFLEIMGDELAGNFSPTEMRSLVEAAIRNGQRLQKLVDDLLAVAQIEAGGLPRRFDPVGISALVGNVGEIMMVIARRAMVELTIEIDDSVGWIIGDAEQLERVLVNIVGNAVKFTPSGGTVKLSATGCTNAQDLVILEVVDSGIGIPNSEQERLFTRFFRTSTAKESAVAGTGLGLAIAAEIIDAHDGTISVVSSPGRGSTFTVRLPRSPARYADSA